MLLGINPGLASGFWYCSIHLYLSLFVVCDDRRVGSDTNLPVVGFVLSPLDQRKTSGLFASTTTTLPPTILTSR